MQHVVMEKRIAQGDVMYFLESMENLKFVKLVNMNGKNKFVVWDLVNYFFHSQSKDDVNLFLYLIHIGYEIDLQLIRIKSIAKSLYYQPLS